MSLLLDLTGAAAEANGARAARRTMGDASSQSSAESILSTDSSGDEKETPRARAVITTSDAKKPHSNPASRLDASRHVL